VRGYAMKPDTLTKALLATVGVLVACVGWFIVHLDSEVNYLRQEVVRLTVAVEISLGGDPLD